MYTYKYLHMHIYIYTYIYVYIFYSFVYIIYIYIHNIYIYICMYVCTYNAVIFFTVTQEINAPAASSPRLSSALFHTSIRLCPSSLGRNKPSPQKQRRYLLSIRRRFPHNFNIVFNILFTKHSVQYYT